MSEREREREGGEGRKEGRYVGEREREGVVASREDLATRVCVDGKCRLRRRAWFRALDGVCVRSGVSTTGEREREREKDRQREVREYGWR